MRKVAGVLFAAAMVLPIGLVASPAGAAGGTSCKTQAGTVVIVPGLTTTNHAQTITATTKIAGCVGGGVTSGSGKAVIKAAATSNCAGLAKTGMKSPINETITWNTKKTSTAAGSSVTGPKAGQATITLKITKGVFVGLHGSTVVAFTPGKGQDCSAAHPIKNLTIKQVKPFVIK